MRRFLLVGLIASIASAQSAPPNLQTQPEPAMSQIRKSVGFLRSICVDAQNKTWESKGTGFFLEYSVPELPAGIGFGYLVTNRHVALCLDDNGTSRRVTSVSVSVNSVGPGPSVATEIPLNSGGNLDWVLPTDDSVDLAVAPLVLGNKKIDYKTIPMEWLLSKEDLQKYRIVEGERVFFTGFFVQFPGFTRIEPVVRQGILAMMPQDPIPLGNKPQRLFLADMHSFHGNSGSPVFVNLGGQRESVIYAQENYRIIGVLNGGIMEDLNFNLQLTSTAQGKAGANSGITAIVPADELRQLLEDPRLRENREAQVKQYIQEHPASPPK